MVWCCSWWLVALTSPSNSSNSVTTLVISSPASRMLLCAVHAARHGHTKVVLRTVDTDVIVSVISQMQNLYLSIRALVGVWCAGKHYRIIPVLTITIGIGSAKPSALPFSCINWMCHYTSIAGRGKGLHGTHGTYSQKLHQHFQLFLGTNLIWYYVWKNQTICSVIVLKNIWCCTR